jgi:hypothetical protein
MDINKLRQYASLLKSGTGDDFIFHMDSGSECLVTAKDLAEIENLSATITNALVLRLGNHAIDIEKVERLERVRRVKAEGCGPGEGAKEDEGGVGKDDDVKGQVFPAIVGDGAGKKPSAKGKPSVK